MKVFTIRKLTSMFLLIVACGGFSCKDDENIVVNSAPSIQLLKPQIETFPNKTFNISATIADEAGIKSIHLGNEKWMLNKTIKPTESPKAYDLQYKFTVPGDETVNSTHIITITVTNIGDKVTEVTVPVSLTEDVTAPSLVITAPINAGSYVINPAGNAPEFSIKLSMADDKQLSALSVKSAALGLDETINLSGTVATYEKAIDFNTPGTYDISLNLTDAGGNVTTATRQVELMEALQFSNMYLTDVFTANELSADLFGVPQLMTPSSVSGEVKYVFTTRYYAAAAGTEIKFIPQPSSFAPFVFGASTNVENGLVIGGDSKPIILPAKGYYQISMDLRTMKYTATAYTPSDNLRSEMYMAGRGYDGQNWDPSVATALTRSTENPYQFTLSTILYYEAGGNPSTVQWIFISSRSWNLPYWRFDSAIPTKVVPSISSDLGGTNVNITIPVAATYKITFDYHLNTIKAVKQ